MAWQQLSVITVDALCERLADLLTSLGALSISLDDAGSQPLYEPGPGEAPIWQATRVTALFEEEVAVDDVRARVSEQLKDERLADWQVTRLEDRAWERVWLEHFKPMRFGRRLWVCSTGQAPPAPDALCLTLDPGLAFGTGTHPTTGLCLEWLDGQDLRGASVIDYGCGSGILAIAAIMLGARSAHAVDVDPQALTATRENARKNKVEAAVHCCYPEQLGAVAADILIANILAKPLVALAPGMAARVRPGGQLVLSGILAEQTGDVRRAFASAFDFSPAAVRDNWVRLAGVKR
jgi:ribosomal protein L11 methyltransferase